MQRRVLIVSISFRPNLGGVETHLDDLCRNLTKSGLFVYVLSYQPITTLAKGLPLEKGSNLEIRRVNWPGYNLFHKLEPYPLLEFFYLFPGLFWAVFWFMVKKHRQIDAIHAHGFVSAIIVRLVNVIYAKTLTMSTHAIYDFRQRGLMAAVAKWVLSGFDTIMPLAETSKQDLLAAGVPEGKIKIYTQWVDQELFRPRKKRFCRFRLGLENKFTALFVGRLIEKKGVLQILRAAMICPQVNFVLVGQGPMFSKLCQKAKRQKNIILAGAKSQRETARYYNASDLVLIPSQYEEGFARVVLEALSSGIPVVAANKGCLPEMISPEVGVLIEPNPKQIAQTIMLFKDRPRLLSKMASSCRDYALLRFSEKNAHMIRQTYFKKHQ